MELSEFAVRLAVLFVPGLVSYLIVTQLVSVKDQGSSAVFLRSFLLGCLSYAVYAGIMNFVRYMTWTTQKVTFFDALFDKKLNPNVNEILLATVVGVVVGYIVALVVSRKFVTRIAHCLRISAKYGDATLWGYVANSPQCGYILIRDPNNNRSYRGWLEAFSEEQGRDELFLTDVEVFTNEWKSDEDRKCEYLYGMDSMYIARKFEDIRIEFEKVVEQSEETHDDSCTSWSRGDRITRRLFIAMYSIVAPCASLLFWPNANALVGICAFLITCWAWVEIDERWVLPGILKMGHGNDNGGV